MSKINGDDVELHHGDKVITLDEQLDKINRSLRWLRVSTIVLGIFVVLSMFLTDEHMIQLVDGVLGLFIGD